jgi:hypothetical protein
MRGNYEPFFNFSADFSMSGLYKKQPLFYEQANQNNLKGTYAYKELVKLNTVTYPNIYTTISNVCGEEFPMHLYPLDEFIICHQWVRHHL